MKSPSKLHGLAPNLWTMTFPLKVAGIDLQRVVTVIRLSSGKLVIHSTAPFAPADIEAIRRLGEPGWLVEALLRHDTFAEQGRRAFPAIPYLAPPGFAVESAIPLVPPPAEWEGEIRVRAIDGAPDFSEIVMLHIASRTLIVGDLIFNFTGHHDFMTRCALKLVGVGGHHEPGMTRPFKHAIDDPAAYAASVREVLAWDFDRIIVGHGAPIAGGGREKLRHTLAAAGIEGL